MKVAGVGYVCKIDKAIYWTSQTQAYIWNTEWPIKVLCNAMLPLPTAPITGGIYILIHMENMLLGGI